MENQKNIPSIDLGLFNSDTARSRIETGQLVDDICRQIGFLKIKNHGIPKVVINNAWNAAENFFSLPEKEKNKYKPKIANSPRGYFPMQSETLTKSRGVETPPDLKEAFSCGSEGIQQNKKDNLDFFYGNNIWPNEPKNFKDVWQQYYQAMEKLSLNIMGLFAVSLGLKSDYFNDFYTNHISALRALNYPSTNNVLLPDQQRAGAHTDYGSLTILLPDHNVGGLEVKHPNEEWIPIEADEDTFIINIGDMMARWTNDRWVSTLHRVVTPNTSEKKITSRRQSIAFFQNPNFDAKINCLPTCLEESTTPKYSCIEAGQYLMDRFHATIK
ncbi:hypothetical protein N9K05_05280 [Woeseiaceae bacterium]|jgi:isopenicillin N synthase-like dioxygenase|nr:hypothetical protein [Woeseiaceae bacterium]